MHDDAEAWLRQRTSHWRDWPLRQLMNWKHSQATRISVVIPTRNEEARWVAWSPPPGMP